MFYLHGFGDTCSKYGYLGKIYAKNGYHFLGFDYRGFGFSEGTRGKVESPRSVCEDLHKLMELAESTLNMNGLKKYICGMSFGGRVAL